MWQFCLLNFNYQIFLGAFDRRTSTVDFQVIHQSLKQSMLGGAKHRRKPTIFPNHLYTNKVASNKGAHFLPCVICTYANTQPLRAFPIFANARWSHDFDAVEFRNIQRWGITDRLNRIKLSPLRERLILKQQDRDIGRYILRMDSVNKNGCWNV